MKILKSAIIASVAAQDTLTAVENVLAWNCDIHGDTPNGFNGRARKFKKNRN